MRYAKYLLILCGVFLVLLFACTKGGEKYDNCNDYCAAQPHALCEGNWDITGTYPDCICNYICDTQDDGTPDDMPDDVDDDTPTGGSEVSTDARKVYSDDKLFYLRVADNEIEDGFVTYELGERLVLGGPGLDDVDEAHVYLKESRSTAKLVGIMHEFRDEGEDILDFPIKSQKAGTISVKLFDSSDDEIMVTGLELNIVPKIV